MGQDVKWIGLMYVVQDMFPVARSYEDVNDISCDINAGISWLSKVNISF
jgi:hypothetical protein